ncbi:MAG TPA: hypothetical protein VGD67_17795 [Pseudonocardiaceae bacterium]
MSDPDTGDVEGLAPQEALDPDERLDNDDDSVDPPDGWSGADRFGTTPAEEAAGAPLADRLAEERPEEYEAPRERAVADTPIDELDQTVDEERLVEPVDDAPLDADRLVEPTAPDDVPLDAERPVMLDDRL